MAGPSYQLPAEPLRKFLKSLFRAAGATDDNASIVSNHLIDNSLMGLLSHGILRVPDYLSSIRNGAIQPNAQPHLVRSEGSTALLHAANCFGPVAGQYAVREILHRAPRQSGIAAVTVRQAGHLGRVGAYPEALANSGYLALAFCSVPAKFHQVAWYGTKEGRLGTNPIAFAFPTLGSPVVADFSTSAIPEGKVRLSRNQGHPVPAGVLRDSSGNPTTDPEALYSTPPGTLQPLGGEYGYKGSALGLLVEAMATFFADESINDLDKGNNLSLIALRVPSPFKEAADSCVSYIHSAEPLNPDTPAMLPGEPEHKNFLNQGPIPVDKTSWTQILKDSKDLNVKVPSPLSETDPLH